MDVRDLLKQFTTDRHILMTFAYKEFAKNRNTNFLMSPFSNEIMLALVSFGARGDTFEEIRVALGYSPDFKNTIITPFKYVMATLQNHGHKYLCLMRNKIYMKQTLHFTNSFKIVTQQICDLQLETIDFTDPDEAARGINSWMEKETEGYVQNLVEEAIINRETNVLLVNFLYFRAFWRKQFATVNTAKRPFYTPTDILKVDTLQITSSFKYAESASLRAKFLELSFKTQEGSMVIVLPMSLNGLDAVEEQIQNVLQVTDLKCENVIVMLPKFKIRSKLYFKDVLQKMGVVSAFRPDLADFRGMVGRKSDGVCIDEIIQEVFLEVDEHGVESDDFIHRVPNPATFPSQLSKLFIADHPFFFYIKIKHIIIFMGRVVNPESC